MRFEKQNVTIEFRLDIIISEYMIFVFRRETCKYILLITSIIKNLNVIYFNEFYKLVQIYFYSVCPGNYIYTWKKVENTGIFMRINFRLFIHAATNCSMLETYSIRNCLYMKVAMVQQSLRMTAAF